MVLKRRQRSMDTKRKGQRIRKRGKGAIKKRYADLFAGELGDGTKSLLEID